MDQIQSIINFLSENNLKKLSFQVEKITDLYLKPLKVWKKILNQQKTSINLFLFYVFVYGLTLFIFSPDIYFVVKFIMLQLIVTIQPFLISLLPFLFYTWIWKINIKANRLFRMAFIYTLQIFPFVSIPMLVADKYGIESPYIISENAFVFTDILLIIIIPLLINISAIKKIIWIVTNYTFLLLFINFASYFYSNFPDAEIVRSKLEWETPMNEYLDFENNYKDSDLKMGDGYLLIYVNNNSLQFYPQYSTFPLLNKLIENQVKIRDNIKVKTYKLLQNNDTTGAVITDLKFKTFKSDQLKIHIKLKKEELFPKKTLDSLKNNYDKIFYYDLKYTDSLKSFGKFRENKRLFKLFYKNLNTYDSIYSNSKIITNIVKTQHFQYKIHLDDDGIIYIYDLISTKEYKIIKENRHKLKIQYQKVLDNFTKCSFLRRYLYFPNAFFSDEPKIKKKYEYITDN